MQGRIPLPANASIAQRRHEQIQRPLAHLDCACEHNAQQLQGPRLQVAPGARHGQRAQQRGQVGKRAVLRAHAAAQRALNAQSCSTQLVSMRRGSGHDDIRACMHAL